MRKKCLALLIAVLLLIPMLTLPAAAAEAEYSLFPFAIKATPKVREEVSAFLAWISDKPFATELFTHFVLGKGDVDYWEEEVPGNIQAEILANETYQAKLQYVLERAYSTGSYKVDFIFDRPEGVPPPYNEPSFNETKYDTAGLVFSSASDEMFYAIHAVNGHMVIGAEYLGNNQFSVWTALSDYYDFAFENCLENMTLTCLINDTAYALQQAYLGHPFTVYLGFTHTCTWMPPTQEPAPQPSAPVPTPTAAPIGPQTVSGQYYARGTYDIGTYTGDWSQGVPNGQGTLVYNSQTEYRINYLDGSSFQAKEYTGNWVNGRRCGQGIFTFTNGIRYEGVWNTDGYYFRGYVKSSTQQQYIEQTASGNTITDVYKGPVESIR